MQNNETITFERIGIFTIQFYTFFCFSFIFFFIWYKGQLISIIQCLLLVIFFRLCLLLMVVSLETCELTFHAFNTSPNHICFMSKSKIGTSWCGFTLRDNLSICYRNALKHLVECHSGKFQPTSNIGFHQTSFSSAIKIASSGFKPGSQGMFGPGIYFARSFDHTNRKAHFTGPVIIVQLDPWRV